ncbi:MAG TPA: hypothetical protein VHM28_03375 [Anaerolineales bacterium]|nr:hypothetical protein [Anaerolineales bacterium]
MNITMWVMPLYGLLLVAFGLYVFGIGVWGLVKKRPLVFAARQLMWFVLAMFSLLIIQSFSPLVESFGRDNGLFSHSAIWFVAPFFQMAMFGLVLFIYWRQTTGYMVFGVSDDTFRNALISALSKLNLPFQETVSKLKLTGIDADLQVAVLAWMGTAQFRIKQQAHVHYTKEIAKAMDEYYKVNSVKVNNTTFIVYLLLGIFMLGFAIVYASWQVGSFFLFNS